MRNNKKLCYVSVLNDTKDAKTVNIEEAFHDIGRLRKV